MVENASDDFPSKGSSKISKLRQKFATNFAENFANFTLEIAGAYKRAREEKFTYRYRVPPRGKNHRYE